tara:strand:+ start:213 stop:605 length:393 start_codon:yes stop_codon:yes gene_type:complete
VKKDYDYIARLERAIKEKYGDDAIQNPAKFWNKEKEEIYLQQLKESVDKQRESEAELGFKDVGGFLVSRKLLNKETILTCPVCSSKIKTVNDDIYILKFECCEKCYVRFVEGREQRWLSGWRPKNVTKKL